jgi:hypothetical protein
LFINIYEIYIHLILNEINLFEWILCYHSLVSPTGRSMVVGVQSSDNSYIGWCEWVHKVIFINCLFCFFVGRPTLNSMSSVSCISWNVPPKAHPFAQRFTMIANTVHQLLQTNQSSIMFRDCKLVSLLINIFQEPKWNWHRWSSSIRSTSEQQYAKWVYSRGTTRYIHIKRPTYSAQGNTVTFCRKSDLRNKEIVPCLPVIYKATECICTRTHYG